jgi:MFS family permease
LTCESGAKIGLIGSMIFIGQSAASLVVPRISDLYGRRTIIISSMALNFVVNVVLGLSQSITLTIFMMPLIGLINVGRWTVAYISLMEFLPEKH